MAIANKALQEAAENIMKVPKANRAEFCQVPIELRHFDVISVFPQLISYITALRTSQASNIRSYIFEYTHVPL
jgi:hypothetical protein